MLNAKSNDKYLSKNEKLIYKQIYNIFILEAVPAKNNQR